MSLLRILPSTVTTPLAVTLPTNREVVPTHRALARPIPPSVCIDPVIPEVASVTSSVTILLTAPIPPSVWMLPVVPLVASVVSSIDRESMLSPLWLRLTKLCTYKATPSNRTLPLVASEGSHPIT